MKYCKDCDETKADDQFHKDKRRIDGLAFYCRDCTSTRKKLDYAKNPEPKRAAAIARRIANPERKRAESLKWRTENKERQAELGARWYENNKAHAKELMQQYYQTNKEQAKEISSQWAKNHPEEIKVIKRRWKQANKDATRLHGENRRARLLAASIIPFTADQLKQRWEYYGNQCWICHEVATETDHVKPLSRGGAHILSNLRPICGTCNRSKGANWPLTEWLEQKRCA